MPAVKGLRGAGRYGYFMIGNFAASKAGHDKGKYYVIVGEEGDFVYLCDGRLKPLAEPKKKRRKHIQIINHMVSPELALKLTGHGKVQDEEIKYEIKQYLKE